MFSERQEGGSKDGGIEFENCDQTNKEGKTFVKDEISKDVIL